MAQGGGGKEEEKGRNAGRKRKMKKGRKHEGTLENGKILWYISKGKLFLSAEFEGRFENGTMLIYD